MSRPGCRNLTGSISPSIISSSCCFRPYRKLNTDKNIHYVVITLTQMSQLTIGFDYPLLSKMLSLSIVRSLNTELLRLSTRDFFLERLREPTLKEIMAHLEDNPQLGSGIVINYSVTTPSGE